MAELLNCEQNLYEVMEVTTTVIRITYHNECVDKWNKSEVVLRKNWFTKVKADKTQSLMFNEQCCFNTNIMNDLVPLNPMQHKI